MESKYTVRCSTEMARGDLIKYSSFTNNTEEQIIYEADTGSSGGWNIAYVSAASWYVFVYIKKNWGSWSRPLRLNCYYFNGSGWTKQVGWSRDFGQTTSGEWYYYWGHNSSVFNNLATGNGINKIDAADVNNAPLWKLCFYHPELYLKRFKIFANGIAGMTEAQYNSVCKGNPIYSAGRLSGSSIYYPGQFDSEVTDYDDAAVSLFWRQSRGPQITWANQHKLIY